MALLNIKIIIKRFIKNNKISFIGLLVEKVVSKSCFDHHTRHPLEYEISLADRSGLLGPRTLSFLHKNVERFLPILKCYKDRIEILWNHLVLSRQSCRSNLGICNGQPSINILVWKWTSPTWFWLAPLYFKQIHFWAIIDLNIAIKV